MYGLARRIAAEGVGSMALLAIVVGSGIMASRLSAGNAGLALLANALATGGGLVVLIWMFAPISGAHFNPVVSLVAMARREIGAGQAFGYIAAQLGGALAGVVLAHAMFGEVLLQVSAHHRNGPGQALSEAVATFGLVGTILGVGAARPHAVPAAVGLYIGSAYWFTASTSFANPAVTVARSLTDSFAGIAPWSVPPFIVAQLSGGAAALLFFDWLLRKEGPR